MELTILHLYPDFMSLYGEYANVTVLRRRLEALGVEVTVRTACRADRPDFDGADMIYMGAGTERRQKLAMECLLPVRQELKDAADRGTLILFTGSAMEVLGASVTDAGGRLWQGLALADFTSVESETRTPEDVVALPTLWDAPAVGFMNKCSVTHGIAAPLFHSLPLGFGNDAEHGAEGYVSGNVFATHLTGPVLVKNPDFTGTIIRRIFAANGWELPEAIPALPYEQEAHEVTLKELSARCAG